MGWGGAGGQNCIYFRTTALDLETLPGTFMKNDPAPHEADTPPVTLRELTQGTHLTPVIGTYNSLSRSFWIIHRGEDDPISNKKATTLTTVVPTPLSCGFTFS